MKVGINNKPLPKPLGDAAMGGLLSGGAGLLGGIVDSIAGAVNAKKQRQHDKDMAALNQQYALEQMAQGFDYDTQKMEIQNQYQIDQWNRENEYNDPSAVAERYRQAGINPRAAFGQGSASGAGISGGFSSAPSGGAPSGSGTGSASNAMFSTNFAGGLSDIGSAYLEGRRTDAEVAHKNAETAEQLIENEYKEQNLVADLLIKRGEYEKLVADTTLSKQQRAHYEKLIEQADQQIAESQERTKGYEVQRESVKAQTDNTKASTEQISEDIKLKKVLRQKESALIANITADTGMKEKEAEKIAVDIYHTYIKMGVDATTALKNVNDIITDWVPAPGKLIKKVTEIVHKKSK